MIDPGWRKVYGRGKIRIKGRFIHVPELSSWVGKSVYVTLRFDLGGFDAGWVISASDAGGRTLAVVDL